MRTQHPLFVAAAVGLGGAAGALFRYVIMESSGNGLGAAATGLLIINVLGSALLAVVLVIGERRIQGHRFHHLWRPVLATGVLGGFTSTSAFAVISLELGGMHGVLYAVTSVGLALGAFSAMQQLTQALVSNSRGQR